MTRVPAVAMDETHVCGSASASRPEEAGGGSTRQVAVRGASARPKSSSTQAGALSGPCASTVQPRISRSQRPSGKDRTPPYSYATTVNGISGSTNTDHAEPGWPYHGKPGTVTDTISSCASSIMSWAMPETSTKDATGSRGWRWTVQSRPVSVIPTRLARRHPSALTVAAAVPADQSTSSTRTRPSASATRSTRAPPGRSRAMTAPANGTPSATGKPGPSPSARTENERGPTSTSPSVPASASDGTPLSASSAGEPSSGSRCVRHLDTRPARGSPRVTRSRQRISPSAHPAEGNRRGADKPDIGPSLPSSPSETLPPLSHGTG